ncbi:hypothetical protein E8E13_007725 [Curvularia kusanoi]|uniref:Uncharacterized protein n=1 Tax=Curvularia kusanoi TaxID=90978 RepID=A0A9P4TB04_CURKU|nr:hypothetical protein E8E13_007725 [Curvularia kusanoi]
MPDTPNNSEPEPHESPDMMEDSEDEMDYDEFCRTYLNLPDSESNSPAASVAPSSEHDDYDPQCRDANIRQAHRLRLRIEAGKIALEDLAARHSSLTNIMLKRDLKTQILRQAKIINLSVQHFNKAMADHEDVKNDHYDLEAKHVLTRGVQSILQVVENLIIEVQHSSGSGAAATEADRMNDDMRAILFDCRGFLRAHGFVSKQRDDMEGQEPGSGPPVGYFRVR